MLGWAAGVPRVAWVLFAALPLLQLTISATGPVIPLVRDAFDLSYAAVGVFVSAMNLVRFASNLPAGQLTTRFNGRSLIGVSAAVTVCACLLGALAVEYWQLLLARAVLGGTTAINQAVIMAWLIRLAGGRNRALVMGLQDAGFSIMVVFVPPLSGLLAGVLSWRTPFVLGGLVSQFWPMADAGDEPETNLLTLQPFVNYNFGTGWALSFAPIMTANWDAESGEEWTVPIGIGITRTTVFNRRPMNLGVQYYYNVERPDGSAGQQLRFIVALLFPTSAR